MKQSLTSAIIAILFFVVLGALLYLIWQGRPSVGPQFSPSPTGSASSTATAITDACNINGQIYCVLNPDVRQDTINQTICVSGWTATIRPPVSYTNPLKAAQLSRYAYLHPNDPNWTMSGTEEDHRVPLEGGGAPSDPNNLSPEDHPASFVKDAAENQLKADVCSGRKTLIQAQIDFVKQYLAPYPGYVPV